MINPVELRIGNLIYCNTTKSIVKVQWPHPAQIVVEIRDELLRADHVHGDLKEFDPIPLTEEWLLKFGFEKKDSVYVKEGFNTIADYGGQFISLYEGGATLEFGYYGNQLDCSFVHGLQNLYYVIMGEELTIKDTAHPSLTSS